MRITKNLVFALCIAVGFLLSGPGFTLDREDPVLVTGIPPGIPPDKQPGFVVRLTLTDFMIIQRALMTMPDEKAPAVLERLRKQLSDTVKQ